MTRANLPDPAVGQSMWESLVVNVNKNPDKWPEPLLQMNGFEWWVKQCLIMKWDLWQNNGLQMSSESKVNVIDKSVKTTKIPKKGWSSSTEHLLLCMPLEELRQGWNCPTAFWLLPSSWSSLCWQPFWTPPLFCVLLCGWPGLPSWSFFYTWSIGSGCASGCDCAAPHVSWIVHGKHCTWGDSL